MATVISINEDRISFCDGSHLMHSHYQDCCESHFLDFGHLSLGDFEGLDFDLSTDQFFERIEGFGIRLCPTNGHPISIPGYGYNNGYYSSELTLVLCRDGYGDRNFDISECQVVTE